MAPPILVSLIVSPWSLKARWALKHHGLRYKTQPYTAVVGELFLRWQTGKWSGKARWAGEEVVGNCIGRVQVPSGQPQ